MVGRAPRVKQGSPSGPKGRTVVMQAELTEDLIYGGRVKVRQPRRGYRVNVDTILLAATLREAQIRGGARIVEPGCGVGAAILAIATGFTRASDARFLGIERDPAYAALARQNVELNGQTHRVEIIEADAVDPRADFGVFDHVIFNPPYDHEGEGRPPAEGKRAAYLADRPVGDWISVWCNHMGAHSNITLIHRPHRLGEILAALEGRLGGVEVFPIRPNAAAKARRVIVRAWKGSRAPLKLLKGLDMHPGADSKDKYTPEADAILRGEAFIDLG